jgi:hypothetical protein
MDTVLIFEFLSDWSSSPARIKNNVPYLTNIIYLFVPLSPVSLFRLPRSLFIDCYRCYVRSFFFIWSSSVFLLWRMEYMAFISFVPASKSHPHSRRTFPHLIPFAHLISLRNGIYATNTLQSLHNHHFDPRDVAVLNVCLPFSSARSPLNIMSDAKSYHPNCRRPR